MRSENGIHQRIIQLAITDCILSARHWVQTLLQANLRLGDAPGAAGNGYHIRL